LRAYDKALALAPDMFELEGDRLHAKMNHCDWSNFDAECEHLISSVRNGKSNTELFPFLAVGSSTGDQLQCAKLAVARKYPVAVTAVWQGERYGHDRIRVAYVSADYRSHPVAQAMVEVLEWHDRSRFEIIGLSLNPDDGSELRARLIMALDQFHDVQEKSDLDAARLIRELEADIVVKVAPHTEGSRLGILAHRPAPVQVSGCSAWPSGADFLDYVLADPQALPFDQQPHFSERIVHVPDSYFPQDTTQPIAAHGPSRTEAGLPEKGFVFCSFNNGYKLNPRVFDLWMRLLKRNDGSVLWLMQVNDRTPVNLRREAAARGIDPSRLVFASRLPLLSEHLARHRLADLFLDTLPFGAHTTAKDALWAGLPVLTCRGATFAGRLATSQLHAIGLADDLITESLEDYEAAALRLAQNPDELRAVRDRLAANRLTHPLFDTARLCRHFEAAYIGMWERHRRGEPPQGFAVGRS
jgi:predicted O-linked N-acetylglucosamine transferase (SPINDLY family)